MAEFEEQNAAMTALASSVDSILALYATQGAEHRSQLRQVSRIECAAESVRRRAGDRQAELRQQRLRVCVCVCVCVRCWDLCELPVCLVSMTFHAASALLAAAVAIVFILVRAGCSAGRCLVSGV